MSVASSIFCAQANFSEVDPTTSPTWYMSRIMTTYIVLNSYRFCWSAIKQEDAEVSPIEGFDKGDDSVEEKAVVATPAEAGADEKERGEAPIVEDDPGHGETKNLSVGQVRPMNLRKFLVC